MTDLILGLKGREIRQSDLVTLYGVEGEQFLIFLSRKREGRQFHSTVVAEGIETQEELDMLSSLGVLFGQGFLIAKPTAEFVVPRKP